MKLTDEILETVAAVLANPDVYPLPDALRGEATEWLLTGEVLDNTDVRIGNYWAADIEFEDRGREFLYFLRHWYGLCDAYGMLDRYISEIRADINSLNDDTNL